MGTKILQRRLPDWKVIRCERIEDAVLWEKYTAKRAQPLGANITPRRWGCQGSVRGG